MDMSKLDQNERMALIAAIVVFLAGLVSSWGGLLFISVLAALGVAIVVLLPQFSPSTALPGSRGSLLAALGLAGFAAATLELLIWIGYITGNFGRFGTLLFVVAFVASAVMAWAGWQALQAEGGKLQFGVNQATPAPAPAAAADAPAPVATEPEAPEPEASAPAPDAAAAAEPEAATTDYDPDDYRPRDT
jgi:hypothetical protein